MPTLNGQSTHYQSGTIESFDDTAGYGFILPDESKTSDLLLVHRRSLRDPATLLRSGDRVLFATRPVPRGLLAFDVHHETTEKTEEVGERQVGVVSHVFPTRGYGFLQLPNRNKAFFHISNVVDSDQLPSLGSYVSCLVSTSLKGLQATEVEAMEDQSPPEQSHHVLQPDYLAQALIARDQRRYDEAANLYQKGLLASPTVSLVLSYAAMEKNRNRNDSAMRVYDRGLEIFPKHAKLREDAGILAASLGQYKRALQLLHEAHAICRTLRRSEKGVLLALARTYGRIGDLASLKQSVSHYEEALRKFGRGRTLPESDLLALNVAKIRTQHHRGNVAVQFLQHAAFRILRARLLDQVTVGADLVIRTESPEISDSYGIGQELLVRCMFKSDVDQTDLADLDAELLRHGRSGLIDDQVAFLIVSSLPADLQRALFRRLESRKPDTPAIIPLPQATIEAASEEMAALREILDQWLYRRDLFSLNVPVVGKRFFGRDKALAELRESIVTGTPAGIFGLRKVGKTSLLKELDRRSSEAGDLVVYTDLLRVPAGIKNCDWLYWKLARDLREAADRLHLDKIRWRLGGNFGDYLDIPEGFPVGAAFDSDLSQLLRAIHTTRHEPRPKVVFLFDEIEKLIPAKGDKQEIEGTVDFLGYLRGISQETEDFVIVVTGANASISERSQFALRDNPVFNFFREVYLPFLERGECRVMIRELGRGMGIRFAEDAFDHIYELTGGHPFFTRQYCSFVAGRLHDRPLHLRRGDLEEFVSDYLEFSGNKDFQEVLDRLARDYPAELEVCFRVARAGGVLALDEIAKKVNSAQPNSLRHLIGYQIIRVEGGVASLSSTLLTQYLQRVAPVNS